ncbi:MAG: acyl-CoA desaturase [Chitinophagales bacterium]
MNKVSPRFPSPVSGFQAELRNRVDTYFENTNQSPTGNGKLYFKTLVIVFYFITIYTALVFFNLGTVWSLLLCILLGAGVAAIGFNIMHDGAHGSYSSSRAINDIAASSLDFLGASSFMWRTKHNVIHHTYTNIHHFDDDLNVRPLLRLAPEQKRLSFHQYQYIYAIPLYGLLHIVWITYKDFLKYFTGKIGSISFKKMTLTDELTFWGSKVSFLLFFVFLPVYMKGIIAYLIGFSVFSMATGIFISTVFQLAHVVETVEFPLPDEVTHRMEDEWAIHQVKTTANFANGSTLVTWLAGGLNFQIEHHLFPKVSHVHYPAISKIVKQTCSDYGVPYHEFPTTSAALRSHISYLRHLGQVA